MCLAIAEFSVQWKFLYFEPLQPAMNTELGSGANWMCLVIAELGVQETLAVEMLLMMTNRNLG